VGAWWMGYVIISCLIAVTLIPMFFFPRHLPMETDADALRKNKKIEEKDGKEKENVTDEKDDKDDNANEKMLKDHEKGKYSIRNRKMGPFHMI
jgi:hypothetical protein